MAKAAAQIVGIGHEVKPEQLTAPTPCQDYDVRALVNHVLYWLPVLELAARKQPIPTDRPAQGEQDLTEGDWRTLLAEWVQRLATAWADPAAWQGTTSMGGGEFPSSMAGSMTLVELVLHGWDLARATGQPFDCGDDVAEATYRLLAQMAEKGRAMGAFGPEVAVPESAPPLRRALGAAGRDPDWSPSSVA